MTVTKIAILTRPQFRSQRFLAEGLARMLRRLGMSADVFLHGISWLEKAAFNRGESRKNIDAFLARRRINQLAQYDIFIVSDTMQAFRNSVDIQPLRAWQKPILHYEVFFPGGSPYWLERLPSDALEKFDAYLVVSGIHGAPPINADKVFSIGLDLLPQQPFLRDRIAFTALLDFPRPDHEQYREGQRRALSRLGIKTIELHGEYSYEDIERAYQQSSIAFVACHEAFGVPIVQLQHYGSYIASPERAWVMRHALMANGSNYFAETQPEFTENFCFYRDEDDLAEHLETLRKSYDPAVVRSRFLQRQPEFAQGNLGVLWEALRLFV